MAIVQLFRSLRKICVSTTDFAFCSRLTTDLAVNWFHCSYLSIVDILSGISDSGTAGIGFLVFGHVQLK
jgi:hypothetical protein